MKVNIKYYYPINKSQLSLTTVELFLGSICRLNWIRVTVLMIKGCDQRCTAAGNKVLTVCIIRLKILNILRAGIFQSSLKRHAREPKTNKDK